MKSYSHFKCILLIPLFSLGFGTADAQVNSSSKINNNTDQVKNYVKTLVDVIRNNSAFANALDWEEITNELNVKADTLTSIDGTKQLAVFMLAKLKAAGDNHSFLMNTAVTKSYADGKFVLTKPEAKIISGNIGVISIPNLSTSNSQIHKEFATTIQNLIRDLDSRHSMKGWIVDLRTNTGGSMYPMLAGVGPLVGSGTLGYFVRYSKNKVQYTPWFYEQGASGIGRSVFTRVDKWYQLKDKKTKVAVLIGKSTSSAGEMTAISFSGAKNAKIFGQRSAGLTTGNEPFCLPDGSTLYLAMVYTANRKKVIFKGQIVPDQIVEREANSAEIDAATEWLLSADK